MNPKNPLSRKRSAKQRAVSVFLGAWAFLFLCVAIFTLCVTWDIPFSMDEALLARVGEDKTTHLYYPVSSDVGEAWAELSGAVSSKSNILPVESEDVPRLLKDAFVAMEDHRFYRHAGVDPIRTLKAAWGRLTGKGSFGGSTITQQLIKNIGGERDRTVVRKLREITRAHALEASHTKDEILTAYLNIVPMGEGCVGVGAAAKRYFGKSVHQLTLAEAASLVAIAPAPSRLNPVASPEKNEARRNRVLERMQALGYITEEEARLAKDEPLTTLPIAAEKESSAPHAWYTEQVLREVAAGLRKNGYTDSAVHALLYGGGIRIYTALDIEAQRSAERAFANNELSKSYGDDFHAAAAVFSPATGKLVALVGDLGEKKGALVYSYATDMRRAPGSALKPMALFAPAIEGGEITEATLFDDVPCEVSENGLWPRNSPDVYDGLILAKEALIRSKNTVAVSLLRRLGAERVYGELVDRFRLSGVCRRYEGADGQILTDLAEAPLALGQLTRGVSLFALTRAYLPFCMQGEIAEGCSFYRVEDKDGRVLLSSNDQRERVLSEQTASVMTHMLSGVTEEGSAASLTLPEMVDTAGKTGTSGEGRDRWFVGYTTEYLCGVWCGYEKGARQVTGEPHLALFDALMKPLHSDTPDDSERHFIRHAGLIEQRVCRDSGKIPSPLCADDPRHDRTTTVWVPAALHLGTCDTHVRVFYDYELCGVAYPPEKGREGVLTPVSLISVPNRAFSREVRITDAEYVYRDPCGTAPSEGDVPFFAATVPDGVYIGKSHDHRPFNAARTPLTLLPPITDAPEAKKEAPKEEKEGVLPRRRLPLLPRRALPRLPFFSLR